RDLLGEDRADREPPRVPPRELPVHRLRVPDARQADLAPEVPDEGVLERREGERALLELDVRLRRRDHTRRACDSSRTECNRRSAPLRAARAGSPDRTA